MAFQLIPQSEIRNSPHLLPPPRAGWERVWHSASEVGFEKGFTLIEMIVVIVILVHCLGHYY